MQVKADENPDDWSAVPVQFANLQVLPEAMGRDELILYMRTISRSLGVRCAHCHDMLSEDYAADDLEAKVVAREMMRLVAEFNALTATRPDAPEVTCAMCHRGALTPPLPPVSEGHLQPSA